ncbi:hypothetical protein [Brevibacillus massiliensis]|uniref:hypothetical protein n=1 Tax=Brevibacillus massiliensis TaxID=1118054 RepID=UPI0002F9C993|nr:hypothetical protein [Brevibacillus massiliensis]
MPSVIYAYVFLFLYVLPGKCLLFTFADPFYYGYSTRYYISWTIFYGSLILFVLICFRKKAANIVKKDTDREDKVNDLLDVVIILVYILLLSLLVDLLPDNMMGRLLIRNDLG